MKPEQSTINMPFTALKESTLVNSAAVPRRGSEHALQQRKRFETIVGALERLADLLTVTVAVWLAHLPYVIQGSARDLSLSGGAIAAGSFGVGLLFVLLLDHAGAYSRGNSLLLIRETERILRVSLQSFALALAAAVFLDPLRSHRIPALALLLVPVLLILEKQLALQLMRHLHGLGYGVQNVLIYGGGDSGRRVFSVLVRSVRMGLNPVAVIDDDSELAGQTIYEYGYGRERSAPVIAGPLTRALVKDSGASLLIVAIESLPQQALERIAKDALGAGLNVAYVPRLSQGSDVLHDYVDVDGVLIGSIEPVPARRSYEAIKRVFDFMSALALLALVAPTWAAIAFLIRRDSAGPVFFQQERVGRSGQTFRLYKFRSMRVDAPKYAVHPAGADDPRITRMGRWLRRTSIDELPQLLNVLRGDMSLVGPRPEMPFIVEQYNERHRQRLSVRPGITGLWQLSADRMFQIHENIHYDLYYIRHRNFFMDFAILLHTAVFAMRGV